MSKRSNDADRITGLMGIIGQANKPKTASGGPPSPAPTSAPSIEVEPAPARSSKPAKVGKYRDPAYHHFGVYLKKDTHKQVRRRLEDIESDQDVSELVQTLLERWLAEEGQGSAA